MRRMRAALRTQTAFRRHAARSKFLSLKGAALALQCATRWRKAAKVHTELRYVRARTRTCTRGIEEKGIRRALFAVARSLGTRQTTSFEKHLWLF